MSSTTHTSDAVQPPAVSHHLPFEARATLSHASQIAANYAPGSVERASVIDEANARVRRLYPEFFNPEESTTP